MTKYYCWTVDGEGYVTEELPPEGSPVRPGTWQEVEVASRADLVFDRATGTFRNDPDAGARERARMMRKRLSSFSRVQLEQTDHLVLRHMEQRELVAAGRLAATSLTEEEFLDLLSDRQALRDEVTVPLPPMTEEQQAVVEAILPDRRWHRKRS